MIIIAIVRNCTLPLTQNGLEMIMSSINLIDIDILMEIDSALGMTDDKDVINFFRSRGIKHFRDSYISYLNRYGVVQLYSGKLALQPIVIVDCMHSKFRHIERLISIRKILSS